MQEIVTRLFLSRQVRWDLILRVSRKIHDMFLARPSILNKIEDGAGL